WLWCWRPIRARRLSTSSSETVRRGTVLQAAEAKEVPRMRAQRPGRAILLWGLAFFVTGQAALSVVIGNWKAELRDPEYSAKLDRLSARCAEQPERPLLLALGSSRTECGLRPDLLCPSLAQGGTAPLVLNFGLSGFGPVSELLCLRRLLDQG